MLARSSLFSEARFQWRQRASASQSNRPGPLFGTPALAPLEQPWPYATTGDLLGRAIQDVDLSGNAYFARRGDYLYRLRPDAVTIIVDGGLASDAEVIGFRYEPKPNGEVEYFFPEQVIHWKPILDPAFRHRGMSWLLPVTLDVMGDKALIDHKLRFWENSATPNMVINAGEHSSVEGFRQWVENYRHSNEGRDKAHSSLILANGASAEVVGSDLKSLDLASVQGAGERRIAAASGVPAMLVGISSEVNATYSNWNQARRALGDLVMRPLWRSFCAAAENVLELPSGAELVVDDRQISFMQEDIQDAATIRNSNATAIRTLVDGGFTPDSVVQAIEADDLSLLEHTGLTTVQVGPQAMPGSNGSNGSGTKPAESALVTGNGNGS